MKNIFKDKLLLANFISNLFYSTAYPTVHFVLIKNIDERIISLNSIIVCIAGIITPMIWNKKSDEMYSKYGYLLTMEGISYILLTLAFILGAVDSKLYYLIDTILFSIITKNIICGGNKLRAIRYNGEEREKFDNDCNILSNASSLIGFTVSLLLPLPKYIAFIMLGLGIISDNIFYYRAYKEGNK